MKGKTLFLALISVLTGAAIEAPAAGFAQLGGAFNQGHQQQQAQAEQRNSRQDMERQRGEPRNAQRDEPRNNPRAERNQPRAEQNHQQRVQPRNTPRVEQRAQPRANPRNQPRVERPAQPRPGMVQPRPGMVQPRSFESRRNGAHTPRRQVESRRSFHIERPRQLPDRRYYRPVPRDRYYRGIHVYRHYGHRYPGFGFYYDDDDAFRWLAFTVMTLAIINQLDEHQQRLQEQALIQATTADIGDTIYWREYDSYGSVTVTDIWYDRIGRQCRELHQRVTHRGYTESNYRSVCRNRSGVWVVVGLN